MQFNKASSNNTTNGKGERKKERKHPRKKLVLSSNKIRDL